MTGHKPHKDMWAAVRQLTGRQQRAGVVDRVSADSLNSHYAEMSTDDNYAVPLSKQSAREHVVEHVTEWCVFQALDNLRPTATGLDQLPAWFLRLGRQPLLNLYHTSSTFHSPPPLFLPSENLPILLQCPKSRPPKSLSFPPNIYHICAIESY